MVLGGRPPGRVGRRRILRREPPPVGGSRRFSGVAGPRVPGRASIGSPLVIVAAPRWRLERSTVAKQRVAWAERNRRRRPAGARRHPDVMDPARRPAAVTAALAVRVAIGGPAATGRLGRSGGEYGSSRSATGRSGGEHGSGRPGSGPSGGRSRPAQPSSVGPAAYRGAGGEDRSHRGPSGAGRPRTTGWWTPSGFPVECAVVRPARPAPMRLVRCWRRPQPALDRRPTSSGRSTPPGRSATGVRWPQHRPAE